MDQNLNQNLDHNLDHNLLVDRLSDIPDEVVETIFSQFDFPEVNLLKEISKKFGRLVQSNAFSEVYNHRPENFASTWLIAHIFMVTHQHYGVLYCVRESDGLQILINLGKFLGPIASPNGRVALLATNGSLVLLRYTDPRQVINLFVINIATNQIHTIPVPEIVDEFPLYIEDANFIVEPRAAVPHIHEIIYKVVVAEFRNGNILRYCCYSSATGEWAVSRATRLEENEIINPNVVDGVTRASNHSVLLLSLNNLGEPVYKNPSVDDFVDTPFNNASATFTADDMRISATWTPTIERYYSLDGWAVMLLRRTKRNDDVSRVQKICLFRINEDWSSYEHVSTTPQNVINNHIFFLYGGCYVQQVGPNVKFSMVTQFLAYDSDDCDYAFYSDDDGVDNDYRMWRILEYTFNTTNGRWTYISTPIYEATHVENVVFSSRLTLGLTA